ncbi:MAG TPA: sialidase family protein [Actinomycetota bacterium]|nr:sialidase family protein [Actinomycetota bacterium]
MRKSLSVLAAATVAIALALPGLASADVPPADHDDKITGPPIEYVRHDLFSDATIDLCNNTEDPAAFGAYTQNNEPFSVVSPTNPDLVIAGWNDYCSGWMGLGFSTDGGETWTDSLVPGYVGDTSAEGMASPEFGRTNAASDPVAAFNADGTKFYFGSISFNEFAGPKSNSDVWVARYDVLQPTDDGYEAYPLDYLGTTRVGRGPAAANLLGIFNDKEMVEVDRAPDSPFEGNLYECWTKFPGNGTPTIRFRASSDEGLTFSPPVNLTEGGAGQGCDIAVESDGDVYVIWRDFEFSSSHKNFGVSFARSTDGGLTFSKHRKIRNLVAYNPFDTARDCGDGPFLCPSGFVFHRYPLEPRITADPTGELPGVYAIFNAVDPSTMVASETSYSSAGFGTGMVGQSFAYISRTTNNGTSWSDPIKVSNPSKGHAFFPDGDALAGRLAVVWQDSREDDCYSVQRPASNTADATRCDDADGESVNSYVAVSTDGATFGPATQVSSVSQMPQYEMFGAADIPFLGDYNWIQLAETGDGSLFGYLSWTDNRDVVPGDDPREDPQDGFDVLNWVVNPDGTFTRQFNLGGLDQNIYGNSIEIP